MISLCLIVRDEERNLPRCLASVRGLFDETIVVDTGSRDQTRAIASGFGARVFDLPWPDDFSAARNFAKGHARGDWIMWLDADERLEEPSRSRLRALLGQLNHKGEAYLMRQVSGPRPDGTTLAIDHVRLFPNRPDAGWEGRIHEQLVPSLKRVGLRFQATDIAIAHSGYDYSETVAAKSRRNLALLEQQRAEQPGDAFTACSYGMELLSAGRAHEAVEPLEQAYRDYAREDVLFGHLAGELARAYRMTGRPADALQLGQAWPTQEPLPMGLLYQLAIASRDVGDLEQAERLLRALLAQPSVPYLPYGDLGLQGAKGQHALAGVLWAQDRRRDAAELWARLTDDAPDCLLGWRGLGMTALNTGDERLLARVTDRLAAIEGGDVDALILRSQWELREGELVQAHSLLEQAVELSPSETPARLLLAQCLLRDRSQWDAAEQSLLDVLRLEPHNREAQHNLGVLRRKRAADQGLSRPSP